MKKCCTNSISIHAKLQKNICNRQRVGYIRLARLSFLIVMILFSKFIGGNDFWQIVLPLAIKYFLNKCINRTHRPLTYMLRLWSFRHSVGIVRRSRRSRLFFKLLFNLGFGRKIFFTDSFYLRYIFYLIHFSRIKQNILFIWHFSYLPFQAFHSA